jgi:hypothetical protein
MPFVKPKTEKPPVLEAVLGAAVGRTKDFHVLAYCPDLDEMATEENPDHDQYTFVLRYQLPDRKLVGRYPRRLDGLWKRSDGTLMAVGDTQGYVEITDAGLSEVSLGKVPGVFSAIWGASDAHVFAAGSYRSFVYYQRHGKWQELPLPEGTAAINAIGGFSEDDVYFAGEEGQVLHFDGQAVTRLRVPARFDLTGIARLNRTQVCISGYGGTLLVGNRSRWRHVVTQTHDDLLALAVLNGRIHYVADDEVWSTDGSAPATSVFPLEATWISGLDDGLVLGDDASAKLYASGTLTDLDIRL